MSWAAKLFKAGRIPARLINIIGVVLYSGVMLAISSQVFMRYVANRPVRWSEELPIVLLTFAVFLMVALRVRQEDHVAFDLVFNVLPVPVKEVVNVVAQSIVAIAFAIALPGIIDFSHYMRSLSTQILRIPYSFVYYFFVLMIASLAVRSAWSAITSVTRLLGLTRSHVSDR